MLKMMVELKYLSEAEIADIPTLVGGFRYAVYAPLAKTRSRPTSSCCAAPPDR